jgi:hypothetical protein
LPRRDDMFIGPKGLYKSSRLDDIAHQGALVFLERRVPGTFGSFRARKIDKSCFCFGFLPLRQERSAKSLELARTRVPPRVISRIVLLAVNSLKTVEATRNLAGCQIRIGVTFLLSLESAQCFVVSASVSSRVLSSSSGGNSTVIRSSLASLNSSPVNRARTTVMLSSPPR